MKKKEAEQVDEERDAEPVTPKDALNWAVSFLYQDHYASKSLKDAYDTVQKFAGSALFCCPLVPFSGYC